MREVAEVAEDDVGRFEVVVVLGELRRLRREHGLAHARPEAASKLAVEPALDVLRLRVTLLQAADARHVLGLVEAALPGDARP